MREGVAVCGGTSDRDGVLERCWKMEGVFFRSGVEECALEILSDGGHVMLSESSRVRLPDNDSVGDVLGERCCEFVSDKGSDVLADSGAVDVTDGIGDSLMVCGFVSLAERDELAD